FTSAYYCSVCLCFFFQAEDGIRDFHVTGVQTCALPISPTYPSLTVRWCHVASKVCWLAAAIFHATLTRMASCAKFRNAGLPVRRSEERRVGKEWRSRWSTYE